MESEGGLDETRDAGGRALELARTVLPALRYPVIRLTVAANLGENVDNAVLAGHSDSWTERVGIHCREGPAHQGVGLRIL